ncbi:MAG: hypothetical protein ACLQVN_04370 [Bryobacteraceae bacterium]
MNSLAASERLRGGAPGSPRATRSTRPFETSDNTLLLAEGHGAGATGLNRIEVRGLSIERALYRYDG